MDEELLYMMRKISLNWTMQLEMNLKDKNVTGIQVYFLVYILRHHDERYVSTELYHEIGVSKATLSAMIKKLIKEGYLYFRKIRKISGKESASDGKAYGQIKRNFKKGQADRRIKSAALLTVRRK